jgi:hypothetical protein
VALFVRPATALTPLAAAPAVHDAAAKLAAVEIPEWFKSLHLAGPEPCDAAEPVAAFVQPTTALIPLAMATPAAMVPEFALLPLAFTWGIAGTLPAPLAEPAERFLQLSNALTPVACTSAAPLLQEPRIAPEFEPLADEPMEPPAICLRAMAAPAAEPVCLFVHMSEASFLAPSPACALPAFTLEASAPHIPYVAVAKPASAPEPVMSGVYPRMADFPVTPISPSAEISLPETPGLTTGRMGLAAPAEGLAAEPAERMVIPAASAIPLPAAAEFRAPQIAGFALTAKAAPALGQPAGGLEPEPLEAPLVASSVEEQAVAARMRVMDFTIEASEDLKSPGFDTHLEPNVAKPRAGLAKVVALQPLPMIPVTAPEPQHERFLTALPHPGMQTVEFHTQRSRTTLHQRTEWKTSRLPAIPPKFAVRPVFGKLEEPAQQPKQAKKEPEFIKTFQRPAASKELPVWLLAGKIAAAVLLASALWYAYSFRAHLPAGPQLAAAPSEMPSSGHTSGSAIAPATGLLTTASSGPMAWMRQTIARRASVEVTDHFREGMEGWGSNAAATPAGWSRHPDGYTIPGALAFFRPSMNFKDYRFEFFGQIEKKGMSWSVRSKDPNNYHAMKVAVMEAGLRPFVALVHWDVINGKAGKPSRTPLNIMVHNNRPLQVAVNVEGDHLITTIDGEEVDTFTNTTLASGGVGFFSEANERARLYWMRVSKNDDWLGHMCGFLAGDDAARATAELWGPQTPGNQPAPGMPGEENTALAAVWAGLPYLRAAQRSRASNTRRTKRWNT